MEKFFSTHQSPDNFERLASLFVSYVARRVPERLVSCVFSSPLSARSPDTSLLWHSGFRQNHSLKLLASEIVGLPLDGCRGLLRTFKENRQFTYSLSGKVGENLLVVSSWCASFTQTGECKTNYVRTDERDALFVFGTEGTCGNKETKYQGIGALEKFKLTIPLILGGLRAIAALRARSIDAMLVFIVWVKWVASLGWLHNYYLEVVLSDIVNAYRVQRIGCVHEMHSYARIVWGIVSKFKLKGYTVQHAVITQGKRWYFVYPEEISAGLKLPTVMYVYNRRVASILGSYLTNSEFRLGCSSRYVYWKEVSPDTSQGTYYLFAGALARFDNIVLLNALTRVILNDGKSLPIRIRLHPLAKLPHKLSNWLDKKVRDGAITLSKGASLLDDLRKSMAVIGMSTTVLEEALLLGKPVIQITHPDYLRFVDISGAQGAQIIRYDKLSIQDLKRAALMRANPTVERERLGLSEREVTYSRLFEE